MASRRAAMRAALIAGLAIPVQDEIGQRFEGFALGARREDGELTPRVGGMVARARQRVLERTGLTEPQRDLAPLFACRRALGRDLRHQRAARRVARQEPDDGERDLAFTQVAADGLAERVGIAR